MPSHSTTEVSEPAALAAPFGDPLSAADILGFEADAELQLEALISRIHDLEDQGRDQSALYLRREHGIWPASHLCRRDQYGVCCDCGGAR